MIIEDDLGSSVRMDPHELRIHPKFSTLFRADRELVERITQSMREGGFDPSKPINAWRKNNTVVDGHQRRLAAIQARVDVVVCFHDFADEEEAMDYAIACQCNRRNLTDDRLLPLIEALDRKRSAGRPRGDEGGSEKLATRVANSKSAEETAKLIGTNRGKVEKTRAVLKHAEETGDRSEVNAVKEGRMTINQANRSVQQKKKRGKKKDSYNIKLSRNGSPVAVPSLETPPIADDDRAWLESFRLRSQVQSSRFDDDALIYRYVKEHIKAIKDDIYAVLGPRSVRGMTPFHRAIHRVIEMMIPPEGWFLCDSCQGRGVTGSSPCRACGACGYKILRSS